MKSPHKTASFLLSAALLFVLFGCASRQKAGQETSAFKMALKPRLELLASAEADHGPLGATHSGASSDAALLADDWKDDVDLHMGEETDDLYQVADPFEKLNRLTFSLNDKLYFWVLKPVATGYRAVLPQPARTGIGNLYDNLMTPIRLLNNILQGKGEQAEAEFARFLYNSTVGILGFGNPARKHAGLNPDPEDFGQTLATYGVGDGFYLVLPLLGPSTLRDAAGRFADGYANPISQVRPLEASIGISAHQSVNTLSFRIGDYETFKAAALDPYEAYRNAYIQLRQSKISH